MQGTSQGICLRSYVTEYDNSFLKTAKIWEVALATTAAPSFFEPLQLGGAFGSLLVDGAMGRNNPVSELWTEAKRQFRLTETDRTLGCIVSVGTGVPNTKELSFSVPGMAKGLGNIATDTEDMAKSFENQHESWARNDQYFRFNPDRGAGEMRLDDVDQMRKSHDIVIGYVGQNRVARDLAACAQVLKNKEIPCV